MYPRTFFHRDEFEASGHESEIKTFFALQFTGGAGFALILMTALLAKSVRRDATWVNFCLTWIISVVSYLLLSFLGRQTGAQPEHALCLFQASLIYAAPVLSGSSTLSLVLQLWYTLKSSTLPGQNSEKSHKWRTFCLVICPYIVWIAIFFVSLAIGMMHPGQVLRADDLVSFYCAIRTGTPGKISAACVAAFVMLSLVFQVHIGLILHRNWRAFNNSGARARAATLSMMIRIALFSIFSLLTIIMSFVFYTQPAYGLINMFIALAPLFSFLILGTQMDIISIWMFWRHWPFRREEPEDEEEKPSFFFY